MRVTHNRLNEYANAMLVSKGKIEDLFDDAIEEDSLEEFNSLAQSLLSSKLSGPTMMEILTQAMDTAYRGTKVTPPTQHSKAIVEYLSRSGVSVPTYPYSAKKVTREEYLRMGY